MKKVKSTKKTTQSKKKIIMMSVIISAVLILGGFLIGFLIWREETKPVLIDNLSFEINSEVINKDLLLEEYEIIDEEKLQTNELGEHEYTIRYKKGGREKELTFIYYVVDTTKPEISADDTYEITEGEEIDIKSKIKISDNSKEEIQPEIEGEYDINKVGEYQLKAKAKDSSNNESEKEFTLKIKEPEPEAQQTFNGSNNVGSQNSGNRQSSNSGSSSSSSGYWCSSGFHYEAGYGCVADRISQDKINSAMASAKAYRDSMAGRFFTYDPGKSGIGVDGLGYVESAFGYYWWECAGADTWYINFSTSHNHPGTAAAREFLPAEPTSACNAGQIYGNKVKLWYVTNFGAG